MEQSWLLLADALLLGFWHGIDWDHIAAILDIVSTTSNDRNSLPFARPFALSSTYALGHASVVAVLGVCALCFSAILPAWVDPVMERLVGGTLVFLGIWVFVSLIRHFLGKEEFRFQSRWMLLIALIQRGRDWTSSKFTGRGIENLTIVGDYGFRTAFSIGIIHGIGAETGTQVLLIAAVGGASSHGLGVATLISFLFGLLLSNTLVAIIGITGFITSKGLKPLYIAAGALTCVFSLVIGFSFIFGQEQRLPDLVSVFLSH